MILDLFLYWYISVTVCFVALMMTPTKMSAGRNLIGSAILAIALGWILWPFAVIAAWKGRNGE